MNALKVPMADPKPHHVSVLYVGEKLKLTECSSMNCCGGKLHGTLCQDIKLSGDEVDFHITSQHKAHGVTTNQGIKSILVPTKALMIRIATFFVGKFLLS